MTTPGNIDSWGRCGDLHSEATNYREHNGRQRGQPQPTQSMVGECGCNNHTADRIAQEKEGTQDEARLPARGSRIG